MHRFARAARLLGSALVLATVPSLGAHPAVAAEPSGHVYVQTNEASGNAVVAYVRDDEGALTYDETVSTGGRGIAPTGLGSQASLAISDDGARLLVVNAGSDDVSLFDITADGLALADVQQVGDRPVSVDVHGSTAYVLNQGADTIQGLRLTDDGTLARIPHSTRPLSGAGVGAAQVAFGPNGRVLAVTEKATQTIDTFVVRPNGRTIGPEVQASSGATPFGFQFGPDGRLYVSEAPASAVSSYDVASDGTLGVISASVPNNQGAACWLIVTSDGRFAYTANAATANVSQYTIAASGVLGLVGSGAAGATDPGPVDLDLTDGDGYLYVLNSRSGSISRFAVDDTDESLSGIGGASGFDAGWAGLIAV